MKQKAPGFSAVGIAAMILAGAWLLLFASPVRQALAAPAQQASPCVVATHQTVGPPVLLLGEDVEIQLTVRATCPFTTPLHIALVIDSSSSMTGAREAGMKQAVKAFIRDLDLSNNPETRVGIVQFDDTALTLCHLTNHTTRLTNCVNRIYGLGGSASHLGVTQALNVLRRGRSRAQDPHEVIILLTDGPNDGGCLSLLQAVGRAKSQAVQVLSVGIGQDYDATCLRQTASSPRFFFQSPLDQQLIQIVDQLRQSIVSGVLPALEAESELPANMELIPGSVFPPADLSPDNKTLSWRANFVPASGITFTYRIRPLEAGSHPVMLRSSIQFRDSANQSGSAAFPQRLVSVMQAILPPRPIAP